MLRTGSCPRCKGNMLLDQGCDGWYEICLQCGFRHVLTDVVRVQQKAKYERSAKNA